MLSNGYKINIDRDNNILWSPCCFYNEKTPLLNPLQFKKAIERTSGATDWLPECSQCQQMEESGVPGLAPRLISFNKIPVDLEPGVCGALEINLDLMCNAACLSCGSYASSTWQKYESKHKITNIGPVVDRSDLLLEQFLNTVPLDSLYSLYILGGEPFYGVTNLKVLRHIVKTHPNPGQIELQYQTNGSIIPDAETIDLWQNFKTVIFSMSIDGVGERFNYLRWPLKWHRVERTLDYLLKNSNVYFSVNATVGPLNVWYFDEIEQWTIKNIPDELLIHRSHKPVRANRCMQPMDLNMTPLSLRQAVIDKYGADHKLSKIFGNLELDKNYVPMFKYIQKHDAIRRLNWRETFPDVTKYFPFPHPSRA